MHDFLIAYIYTPGKGLPLKDVLLNLNSSVINGQIISAPLTEGRIRDILQCRLAGKSDSAILPAKTALRDLLLDTACDAFWVADRLPHPEQPFLFQFDADMTFYQTEVIDELGKAAGKQDILEAITHKAMNGLLDFRSAFKERMQHLNGLPVTAFDDIYRRLPYTKNIDRLTAKIKKNRWRMGIASGGFTNLLDSIREKFALDYVIANTAEVKNNVLTGGITGDIADEKTKRDILFAKAPQYGIFPINTVVIGDGFNDLPAVQSAGVGIAYCAKPSLRREAFAVINTYDIGLSLSLLGSIPGMHPDLCRL